MIIIRKSKFTTSWAIYEKDAAGGVRGVRYLRSFEECRQEALRRLAAACRCPKGWHRQRGGSAAHGLCLPVRRSAG